jgi:hypothetical protein
MPAPSHGLRSWARGADMLTHYFFSCGTRRTARALAAVSAPALRRRRRCGHSPPPTRVGERSQKGVPVYLYQFSHKLSFEAGLEYDLLGDYHVSELYFVWDNQ